MWYSKDARLARMTMYSCNASSGGNWRQEDQTFKARFRYIVSLRSVSQKRKTVNIVLPNQVSVAHVDLLFMSPL